DKSAALKEVREGRGASNTILMVQVPHDSLAGVTPWIAGGGATLRGVPDKNSVAPFVLTTDKNGKPITHNGKRGTYVAMVDGSVRWVDAGIADEVFKAMATVRTPNPADVARSDIAELIEPPDRPKEQPLPKDEPPGKKDVPVIAKKTAPPATGMPAGWKLINVSNGSFFVAVPGDPQTMNKDMPGVGET